MTLKTLCLWNFEEGGEGKYPEEDISSGPTYKQKGEKLYQKDLYMKVRIENSCMPQCSYLI